MYSVAPHEVPGYIRVKVHTLVDHELMLPSSASEEDVLNAVVGYLLEYESVYPHTEDPITWLRLVKMLPGEKLEELEEGEEG